MLQNYCKTGRTLRRRASSKLAVNVFCLARHKISDCRVLFELQFQKKTESQIRSSQSSNMKIDQERPFPLEIKNYDQLLEPEVVKKILMKYLK